MQNMCHNKAWICLKFLGADSILLFIKKKSGKPFQLNRNIMRMQFFEGWY